jgi:imidazoleglycerol-phosphate dehydratase
MSKDIRTVINLDKDGKLSISDEAKVIAGLKKKVYLQAEEGKIILTPFEPKNTQYCLRVMIDSDNSKYLALIMQKLSQQKVKIIRSESILLNHSTLYLANVDISDCKKPIDKISQELDILNLVKSVEIFPKWQFITGLIRKELGIWQRAHFGTYQSSRKTLETNIEYSLSLDGTGNAQIHTNIGFLDHLLSSMTKHGLFDLELKVITSDKKRLVDIHHTIEDVAIVLGTAFKKALGAKEKIVRIGQAKVPFDDVVVDVVVDLSGRAAITDHSTTKVSFFKSFRQGVGELKPTEIKHFIETFVNKFEINMSIGLLVDGDGHHKLEALFKAIGLAIQQAKKMADELADMMMSTKGMLE